MKRQFSTRVFFRRSLVPFVIHRCVSPCVSLSGVHEDLRRDGASPPCPCWQRGRIEKEFFTSTTSGSDNKMSDLLSQKWVFKLLGDVRKVLRCRGVSVRLVSFWIEFPPEVYPNLEDKITLKGNPMWPTLTFVFSKVFADHGRSFVNYGFSFVYFTWYTCRFFVIFLVKFFVNNVTWNYYTYNSRPLLCTFRR